MFYHVVIGLGDISESLYENKNRDEVLTKFLCPFINREITPFEDGVHNMSFFGSIQVWESEKPIDSSWPIKKEDYQGSRGLLYEGEALAILKAALAPTKYTATQIITPKSEQPPLKDKGDG